MRSMLVSRYISDTDSWPRVEIYWSYEQGDKLLMSLEEWRSHNNDCWFSYFFISWYSQDSSIVWLWQFHHMWVGNFVKNCDGPGGRTVCPRRLSFSQFVIIKVRKEAVEPYVMSCHLSCHVTSWNMLYVMSLVMNVKLHVMSHVISRYGLPPE